MNFNSNEFPSSNGQANALDTAAHSEVMTQPKTVLFPPTRVLTARRFERGFSPIPWPHVGGEGLQVRQNTLFQSEAFRDQWRDSGDRRAIYVAACHGARDLSRALGYPVYKVSTTSAGGVWRRVHEMRCDAYGAVWHQGGEPTEDISGWHTWFLSQIRLGYRRPSPGAPIEVDARTIVVSLPDTLSASDFDERFDRAVMSACLEDWILSEAGQAYCTLMDLDPQRFRRFTVYPGGGTGRLSPAREICCFSVFDDVDRLLEIAERILLAHYGLLPSETGSAVSD